MVVVCISLDWPLSTLVQTGPELFRGHSHWKKANEGKALETRLQLKLNTWAVLIDSLCTLLCQLMVSDCSKSKVYSVKDIVAVSITDVSTES